MDITKHEEKTNSSNPFAICDNYINRPKGAYTFGQKWKENFNNTLKLMFECVSRLEDNKNIGRFSYRQIEECINFLTSISVEKQKDDEFVEFTKAFIFLAHNINQNTHKYETIEKKIGHLQRYCDDCLTFSETLRMLMSTTQRISKWRTWSPPSFRLSGHYYDLLKED